MNAEPAFRAGVLLMAHGTPSSLDEMPEYLTLVRGGRAPSEELVHEMRANYGAIGGRSPLPPITPGPGGPVGPGAGPGDSGRGRDAQLGAVHQGRARRTGGGRRDASDRHPDGAAVFHAQRAQIHRRGNGGAARWHAVRRGRVVSFAPAAD